MNEGVQLHTLKSISEIASYLRKQGDRWNLNDCIVFCEFDCNMIFDLLGINRDHLLFLECKKTRFHGNVILADHIFGRSDFLEVEFIFYDSLTNSGFVLFFFPRYLSGMDIFRPSRLFGSLVKPIDLCVIYSNY